MSFKREADKMGNSGGASHTRVLAIYEADDHQYYRYFDIHPDGADGLIELLSSQPGAVACPEHDFDCEGEPVWVGVPQTDHIWRADGFSFPYEDQ